MSLNQPVEAGDRIQFLLYNRNNGQPSYGIGGALMMESEGKVMLVETKRRASCLNMVIITNIEVTY